MALRTPVLSLPRLHTIRAGTLSSEHSRVSAEYKKSFTVVQKLNFEVPLEEVNTTFSFHG